MKILNIAEKPSVAKSISNILSKEISKRNSLNKYIPTYSFTYNSDNYIFTSVLGHITQKDFSDTRNWADFDPKELFDMPIETKIIDSSIKRNLLSLSQGVDKIIIWTDCDREGEFIANEIKELVGHRSVKRARFFAISRGEITNALNNLVEINIKEAEAVEARIELDLRIGAAFTRIQTLALKGSVKSYGSCQVPTLGFIVERNEAIKDFMSEDFSSLNVSIKKEKENLFTWQRGNFFDKNFVNLFYDILSKENLQVVSIESKDVKKFKPYPLRTVELQKKCASALKISPDRAMKIAEDLYNKGYISYPRTETDSFPPNFNYNQILTKLSSEELYKYFKDFDYPRKGKNNDLAHLPIYPLKEGSNLTFEEKKIYDLVVQYFLACCSKDAVGEETKVKLKFLGKFDECFYLEGLKIFERNYLNVFNFDKWEEKKISDFQLNEIFYSPLTNKPADRKYTLKKVEGKTTPPLPMTESELISLMDKNGIGTDATIHEHIKKIQVRNYACKRGVFIFPTKLGSCLIKGYKSLNLDFSTPKLRAELEIKLKKIEKGELCYKEVIKEEIGIYKRFFITLQERIEEFKRLFQEEESNFYDNSNYNDSNNDDDNNNENDNSYKKNTKNKKIINKNIKEIKSNDNNKLIRGKEIKNNSENITNNIKENINNINIDNLIKNKRIRCNCGKTPKNAIVKKESVNSGKTFIFCGNTPKKCKFFLWADEIESYQTVNDIKIDVKCDCGFEPKAEVSRSENNKGKIYLKCKKLYKPCKFFSWMN